MNDSAQRHYDDGFDDALRLASARAARLTDIANLHTPMFSRVEVCQECGNRYPCRTYLIATSTATPDDPPAPTVELELMEGAAAMTPVQWARVFLAGDDAVTRVTRTDPDMDPGQFLRRMLREMLIGMAGECTAIANEGDDE